MKTNMIAQEQAVLENAVIRGEWTLAAGGPTALTVVNRHTGQKLTLGAGGLPHVVLGDGRKVDLSSASMVEPLRQESQSLAATFRDDASGLVLRWSVSLGDDANAIIQFLQLTAARDTDMQELVFLHASLAGARQVGEVAGSVVVCGDLFMGVEHPLAKNTVDADGSVTCRLLRGNVLQAGQTWTFTSALGAVPPGQLRRGFLSYLEQRRAHPYRQFLHYNNWFDVLLGRPMEERSTEATCLAAIAYFGRELVEKRQVKLDAFVWDDGWDDFNSLWNFHRGFPNGFKQLDQAARQYGASLGVWLSPWGGYASAKEKRLAYGKAQGYECNASGFAMAGPRYGKVFRDVCLQMMREQGAIFFKFDGMGAGNVVAGAEAEMADDIDAVLELTRALRRENPEVFINATSGTWASPYWLLFADTVWRQGHDAGFYGEGSPRQQWLTFRDKWCYERIVQHGPLFPLNSVMLHGIIIGNRPGRAPFSMGLDEKDVADDIWSFFGSGTAVQELYVTPDVMTAAMADELAVAARWARANQETLVDTHWIGGDPGQGAVYGWAAWRPGKGIVVLRNPAATAQTFRFTLASVLELPETARGGMTLKAIRPQDQPLPTGVMEAGTPIELRLNPFDVMVLEVHCD